jgi:hypothetical protein
MQSIQDNKRHFMSLNVETGHENFIPFRGLRIKKSVLVAIFAAVLALGSLQANQVTSVSGFGPFSAGDGEYTVIPDAGVQAILSGYANGVTANITGFPNSFQTFCVERNEYITPNTTFDVTLNNTTMFSAIPLTIGAAYLYQQFAMGTLAGYNYSNSPLGSRAFGTHGSAYELQQAIWYFMGEYSFNPYNNYMNGTVAVPANPLNAYTGTAVQILNLWAPGQPHDPAHSFQDLLVLTSRVPEPSTLALAGLGAAALLAFRRRK